MFLSLKHRKQFAVFYFTCFIIYYGVYYWHGVLLHQQQPVFFINRPDLTLNILFLSNLQHSVTGNHSIQLLLDCIYLLLPVLFTACCITNKKVQYFFAGLMVFFNLIYALILSSMSALSIEGFLGWILLPLIFCFKRERSFYYMLHMMRYIFLTIFTSAALWKIRAGGLFNTEEMSAILLKQHTIYLVQFPGYWFSKCIRYLVMHPSLSYSIYLLATIAELFFLAGFFTKKYDRVLIVVFIGFVLFNYFLMEINYFAWVAFLGCLWFSTLTEPIRPER